MPQPAKPDCQSISQHCPQTMSLREITNLSLTTVTDQYICHTHSQPPVTLTESGSPQKQLVCSLGTFVDCVQ